MKLSFQSASKMSQSVANVVSVDVSFCVVRNQIVAEVKFSGSERILWRANGHGLLLCGKFFKR